MKIELDKSLVLPISADQGWALISNIEDVATYMPGAKITERVDDIHYKGTITVKLGPATVNFKGDITVISADPAARTIHITGKGSDVAGVSGASLDLQADVQETGSNSCELAGKSEVNVTGKVAAFGARLMNTATDQLLNIFFVNLSARANAMNEPAAAVGEAPPAQPAPVETKFNALAFIWAVVKDFIRGLFGRAKPG